jgi:predicted amidohydrolase
MKIALAQMDTSGAKSDNLAALADVVRTAARAGAELLVAPEGAMHMPASLSDIARIAEPLTGEFVEAVRGIASTERIAVVLGVWEAVASGVFNTLVAIDRDGALHAHYRKVHLYDAFAYTESDYISPSQDLGAVTFQLGGVTFGLATCYDLRFPESARLLVDAGVDAILLPSAWVPGPMKEDHWHTLLRARAIENTVYMIAANQAAPVGTGRSSVCDPNGVLETDLGIAPGVRTVEIDIERVTGARRVNPSLSNRRFVVVPR